MEKEEERRNEVVGIFVVEVVPASANVTHVLDVRKSER